MCGREFNHSGSFSGHKKRMKECGQYYLTQREKIKENKRLNVKIVKNEKPADVGEGCAESPGQKVPSAATDGSQAGAMKMLSALLLVTNGDHSSSALKNNDDSVGDARPTAVKQDPSDLPPVGDAFREKDGIVPTSVMSSEIECAEEGSLQEAVSVVSHTNVDFLLQETAETANSLPIDKGDAACLENEERKHVGETTESGSKDVGSIPVSRESDEPRGPDVNTGTDDTRASGPQGNRARKRSRPTRTSRGKTSERKMRDRFNEKKEAEEGTLACMHGG